MCVPCACIWAALWVGCIVCSHTFSHNDFCWLSCAIRASDIGPQALQAMSSLTIHVQHCCVPVSAVCADLPSTCNMKENVRCQQRQQGHCDTFLFHWSQWAANAWMLCNGKFHLAHYCKSESFTAFHIVFVSYPLYFNMPQAISASICTFLLRMHLDISVTLSGLAAGDAVIKRWFSWCQGNTNLCINQPNLEERSNG